MKKFTILALLIVACAACKGNDNQDESDVSAQHNFGPDAILLRLPMDTGNGGGSSARAYKYPTLDAAVWTAWEVPRVLRVLGFDAEAGIVSFINSQGNPARLNLRMGQAETAYSGKEKLSLITTANGSDIYAVTSKGGQEEIIRLSPSGTWTFKMSGFPRALYPLNDGGLVIAESYEGGDTFLFRMQPPDERMIDTLQVAEKLSKICDPAKPVSGIICFGNSEGGVEWIRPRGLTRENGGGSVDLGDKVIAAIPTPSGDRIYAVTNAQQKVHVIDRYAGVIKTSIDLPGLVRELRMDPLGRYLIARPARGGGDSAWVIAIGNDKFVGTIPGEWRNDLPAIAPDGMVAVTNGVDVNLLDPRTLQSLRTIPQGGKDYWYFFLWNGFRPRAAGLDQPVSFGNDSSSNSTSDSTSSDSGATAPTTTTSPRREIHIDTTRL